jgi:ketosteroid isomerase-like protein
MEFLKKLPFGTITADTVQNYGNDGYLHTGLYTFLTGPADNRAPVEARFSYMWRKIDGAWKIVHHHSSALPKVPGAAAEEQASEDMYPIAQASLHGNCVTYQADDKKSMMS